MLRSPRLLAASGGEMKNASSYESVPREAGRDPAAGGRVGFEYERGRVAVGAIVHLPSDVRFDVHLVVANVPLVDHREFLVSVGSGFGTIFQSGIHKLAVVARGLEELQRVGVRRWTQGSRIACI